MPVSRQKKHFTITNIPGCGPDEVVFAQKRFTVGDQEAINNQLIALSIENGGADMQTNFGAIKRATLCQMIESWTLKEVIEVAGEERVVDLPQIHEDPDVIAQLDIEVADYLFSAIQMRQNPSELKTEAQQESFLPTAPAPGSES